MGNEFIGIGVILWALGSENGLCMPLERTANFQLFVRVFI
jgi:hypothetical protein